MDKYQLAGGTLFLPVHADATCLFQEVLLATDAEHLDVIVVYTPTAMTRVSQTPDPDPVASADRPASPSVSPPSPLGTCSAASPNSTFRFPEVLRVDLNAAGVTTIASTTVRDVGARGAAVAVRPPR